MHWENQNGFASWVPRVAALLLAAFALAGVSSVAISVASLDFSAIMLATFAPWLVAVLWLAWRSAPVRSVSVDAATSQVTLETRRRTIVLPSSRVSSITFGRGLVWIQSRAKRGGVRLGRRYVLAIYGQDLRDFVQYCRKADLKVTKVWGITIPGDTDVPS